MKATTVFISSRFSEFEGLRGDIDFLAKRDQLNLEIINLNDGRPDERSPVVRSIEEITKCGAVIFLLGTQYCDQEDEVSTTEKEYLGIKRHLEENPDLNVVIQVYAKEVTSETDLRSADFLRRVQQERVVGTLPNDRTLPLASKILDELIVKLATSIDGEEAESLISRIDEQISRLNLPVRIETKLDFAMSPARVQLAEWRGLALDALRLRQIDLALSHLADGNKVLPGDATINYLLAIILLEQGRPDGLQEALRILKEPEKWVIYLGPAMDKRPSQNPEFLVAIISLRMTVRRALGMDVTKSEEDYREIVRIHKTEETGEGPASYFPLIELFLHAANDSSRKENEVLHHFRELWYAYPWRGAQAIGEVRDSDLAMRVTKKIVRETLEQVSRAGFDVSRFEKITSLPKLMRNLQNLSAGLLEEFDEHLSIVDEAIKSASHNDSSRLPIAFFRTYGSTSSWLSRLDDIEGQLESRENELLAHFRLKPKDLPPFLKAKTGQDNPLDPEDFERLMDTTKKEYEDRFQFELEKFTDINESLGITELDKPAVDTSKLSLQQYLEESWYKAEQLWKQSLEEASFTDGDNAIDQTRFDRGQSSPNSNIESETNQKSIISHNVHTTGTNKWLRFLRSRAIENFIASGAKLGGRYFTEVILDSLIAISPLLVAMLYLILMRKIGVSNFLVTWIALVTLILASLRLKQLKLAFNSRSRHVKASELITKTSSIWLTAAIVFFFGAMINNYHAFKSICEDFFFLLVMYGVARNIRDHTSQDVVATSSERHSNSNESTHEHHKDEQVESKTLDQVAYQRSRKEWRDQKAPSSRLHSQRRAMMIEQQNLADEISKLIDERNEKLQKLFERRHWERSLIEKQEKWQTYVNAVDSAARGPAERASAVSAARLEVRSVRKSVEKYSTAIDELQKYRILIENFNQAFSKHTSIYLEKFAPAHRAMAGDISRVSADGSEWPSRSGSSKSPILVRIFGHSGSTEPVEPRAFGDAKRKLFSTQALYLDDSLNSIAMFIDRMEMMSQEHWNVCGISLAELSKIK